MTDRGPLRTYEVTWRSGKVERFLGHQLMVPLETASMVSSYLGAGPGRSRTMIHAEVDGHWRLLLSADSELITTVRDITDVGCCCWGKRDAV